MLFKLSKLTRQELHIILSYWWLGFVTEGKTTLPTWKEFVHLLTLIKFGKSSWVHCLGLRAQLKMDCLSYQQWRKNLTVLQITSCISKHFEWHFFIANSQGTSFPKGLHDISSVKSYIVLLITKNVGKTFRDPFLL